MTQQKNIKDILNKVQNISSGQTSSLPSSIGGPLSSTPPTPLSMPSRSLSNINPLTGMVKSPTEDSQRIIDIQRQVSNMGIRLSSIGLEDEVEAVEDPRNFVEKFFNLPEKQNWVFDLFEILQRPQEAIFAVLGDWTDPKNKGRDVVLSQSFLQGLSGERETRFGQILRNIAQDGKQEDGSFDWTDVVGFAGDIFLDPVDWVTIPLTGGLSFLSKVPETARSTKLIKGGLEAMNKADTFKDAMKIADLTTDAWNTTKLVSKSIEKVTPAGLVFRTIGKGTKASVKLGANMLEVGLTALDPNMGKAFDIFKSASIKKFADTGKTMNRLKTKFAFKSGEMFKRFSLEQDNLTKFFDTKLDEFLPEDKLNELSSLIDGSSNKAIADSFNKHGEIFNEMFEDKNMANKIRDKIANKKDGESIKQIVRTEAGNKFRADVFNLFEYTQLSREPMSLKDALDYLSKQRVKKIPYSEEAEGFFRRAFGDEYDTIVNIDTFMDKTVLNFDPQKLNRKNYGSLIKRYSPNMGNPDNLGFMDEALDNFVIRPVDKVEDVLNPKLIGDEISVKNINPDGTGFFSAFSPESRTLRVRGNLNKDDIEGLARDILDDLSRSKQGMMLDLKLPNMKDVKLNIPFNKNFEDFDKATKSLAKQIDSRVNRIKVGSLDPKVNSDMAKALKSMKNLTRSPKKLEPYKEILGEFFGKNPDDVVRRLVKETPTDRTVYSQLVEDITTIYHDTPLAKELSSVLRKQGITKNISQELSKSSSAVKRAIRDKTNRELKNFRLSVTDPKSGKKIDKTFRSLLGDADKKLYDSMTENNTKNQVYAFRHFLDKYPDDLGKMIDANTIAKIKGETTYDFLTNRWIESPEDIFNTKLNVGTFYTDDDIARLNKLAGNKIYKESVDVYGKSIRRAQEIMGEYLFNDKGALIRNGMTGYTPHVNMKSTMARMEGLTPAQAQAKVDRFLQEIKDSKNYEELSTFFNFGKTATFSDRTFAMSALEANNIRTAYFKESVANSAWFLEDIGEEMRETALEYFQKDMFSTDVLTSFGNLITDKSRDMTKNVRNIETLMSLSMGNPYGESSYFRIMKKTDAVPKNYVPVEGGLANNIKNTIHSIKKLAGDQDTKYLDELLKTVNKTVGKDSKQMMVMENHLYDMFVSGRKPNEVGTFFDAVNNFFKAGKVASPAFNIRNIVGNWYNMWTSGIPISDIPKYWTESIAMHKQYKLIDEKVIRDGIESVTKEERTIHEMISHFKENGFFERTNIIALNDLGSLTKVKNGAGFGLEKSDGLLAKGMKATKADWVMDKNLRANMFIDNVSRLSLYRYAVDNPEYLKKLGLEGTKDGAMDAVRLALFDPNDLSFFERDIMKRVIPFYTWSRQNLAFQAKNLFSSNTSPYYRTWKTFEALWEGAGVDTEDLQEYERDQFYVPIPWLSKDGNYTALKLSLPIADLIEFSTPGEGFRRFMSSTTPILRAPYEATSGVQTFTGQPIERYEGEMSRNIPFLTKKQEWAVGQTGMDMPLKVVSNLTVAGIEAVKGTNVDTREVENLFSNERFVSGITKGINITAMPRNVETNKLYKQYEKLDRLNALLQKQKDANKTVPTLDEIMGSKSSTSKYTDMNRSLQSVIEVVNKYKKR